MSNVPNPLPYTDTKPVGAADFYFAIHATFRFILKKFGLEGLRRYWTELGTGYFAPVTARWRAGGLPAVAAYWRAFFAAEPGAEVEVVESPDSVTLEVSVCPAIKHLRAHGREIVPCFCQHCYFQGEAMAAAAGLTLRLTGGNGACRQTVFRRASPHPHPAPLPSDGREREWNPHPDPLPSDGRERRQNPHPSPLPSDGRGRPAAPPQELAAIREVEPC